MRNTAYKLTAFTAIISAAGFMLRWLQNMQIYDAETGLARRGMPISFIVAGIIVLAAAAFGVIALRLKKFDAPAEPEKALAGKTFVYAAACIAAVMLLAVSGAMQIIGANAGNWAEDQIVFRRILGVATVAAAMALIFILTAMKNPERAGTRRWGAAVLILFAGLWLSTVYKAAASEPVLWRTAVEVLGICAAMMAFYYVAGYFFGQPNPTASIFYCDLGAFLCIMSAIDDHTGADNLCFASVALLLLIWSYTIVANLGPGPQETEAVQ